MFFYTHIFLIFAVYIDFKGAKTFRSFVSKLGLKRTLEVPDLSLVCWQVLIGVSKYDGYLDWGSAS